jgi:GST-like protein
MQLFRRKGWGSALVEAQLGFYGLPFEAVEVDDLFRPSVTTAGRGREAVLPFNPLGQIPTLILDDGTVLTESAAITLWLADRTGSTGLVPEAGAPERAAFLRWLIFLVANIYPCFTFADEPGRFVAGSEARKPFREAVDGHEQRLWQMMESAAGTPWFLGERMSAIDIYLAVMTNWRPRRPWFAVNAPRLHGIAVAADAHPRLADALAANRDEALEQPLPAAIEAASASQVA